LPTRNAVTSWLSIRLKVSGEHPAVAVAQRGVEHPPRLAR
jgi:hypothetical protein